MAVERRAHDRLTVRSVEILTEGAVDANERARTDRVLAKVVFGPKRSQGVNEPKVSIAHRDTARAFVVCVVAQVPRLETTDTEREVCAAAGAGTARGDHAEEHDALFAPTLGIALKHDRVVLGRARIGAVFFVERNVARRETVRTGAVTSGEREKKEEGAKAFHERTIPPVSLACVQ